MVSVDGKRLAASQIIWALCYGAYPGHRLRTKNGDPRDLRLDNLTRYKEHDAEEYDAIDHRAVKAIHLRRVNNDAFANLRRDNLAWEAYCVADSREQKRIIARYRDELRRRYPSVYPSNHLGKAGRPMKSRTI